ncbi:probable serine/threonine-protein kinase PBL1 isoform X1 [Quercus robur]|uniref:probable serine/threonine-protein kinase PBL1 isoform X1 n=1 Tax=Quercus robur TaxID=38942 RepID=UPI0021615C9D|nr:probable serine/threonine-protein kinase PBL1 isoform X1 [Quercus robur]
MEFSVKKYSWRELELLTDSFSEENFVGNIKHGKVYRGKTEQGQEVTVKIWFRFESQNRDVANRHANYSLTRLECECTFLTHPDGMNHPNLVKLIGYCCEVEDHHLGVVYDLRSKDTLLNLIDKDDLNWNQRMQLALAIARVLEYLQCHNPLYQLRFVHPALIMLDQDSNPVLFDFFMLSGGIVGDKQFVSSRDKSHLCYLPYIDIYFNGLGVWSPRSDQFSFAVVLIGLICKFAFSGENWKDETEPPIWASEQYNMKLKSGFQPNDCHLVHESLKAEPGFHDLDGVALTKMIFHCMNFCSVKRPTMSQIVQCLQGLHVFNGDFGVVEGLLQGWDSYTYPGKKKGSKWKGCLKIACLGMKDDEIDQGDKKDAQQIKH